MNALHRLGTVALALFCFLGATATRGEGYIKCQVDGVTNLFTESAHADFSPTGGLHVIAFAEIRSRAGTLSLHLPTPKLGFSKTITTTNIILEFSRSVYSSSAGAHYAARSEVPGSFVDIDLLKLGEIGEIVEGKFHGIVINSLGERVRITDGSFSVYRRASVINTLDPTVTQPIGAPSRARNADSQVEP